MQYKPLSAELRAIVEKYYSGETWKNIKAMLPPDITISPKGSGVGVFGKFDTGLKCQHCQGTVVGSLANKSEAAKRMRYSEASKCLECGHYPQRVGCWCQTCCKIQREVEKAKEKIRHNRIEALVADHNSNTVDVESGNTYSSMAVLAAMFEQSTCENLNVITPLRDSDRPLAPSVSMSLRLIQEVVQSLNFRDAIPPSARVGLDDRISWNGLAEFYVVRSSQSSPKEYLLNMLKSCARPEVGDSEFVFDDIYSLMEQEVLSFLEDSRQEARLPHEVGEKTYVLVKKLLLERPIGEIFYLITKAVNDAIVQKAKGNVWAKQASNGVIGSIERLHERAKASNWVLSRYSRHNWQKQSWLSYVYFNLVLGLSGDGLQYSALDIAKHMGLKNICEGGILSQGHPDICEALGRANAT